MHHMRYFVQLVVIGCWSWVATAAEALDTQLVWDKPSPHSWGSMPIGNGDIGANVWLQRDGSLGLLLSKTDAWDGNCRLLKLGRARVILDPPFYVAGDTFKQVLDLESGSIQISSTRDGKTKSLRIWIDANNPVIRVEAATPEAATLHVHHESWRKKRRQLRGKELGGAYGVMKASTPVWSEADVVHSGQTDRIVFHYRNQDSLWAETMQVQALEDFMKTQTDPLLHRTLGAIMRGPNLKNISDNHLASTVPASTHRLAIYPLTEVTKSVDSWLEQAEASAAKVDKIARADAWAAHSAWWQEFWQRSWIHVTANEGELTQSKDLSPNNKTWRVGVDSTGRNRFPGTLAAPQILASVLSAEQLAERAAAEPATSAKLVQVVPQTQCTLTAWIKPSGTGTGRILETVAVGSPNGFLFDVIPALSLRWSIGRSVLNARNCLKAGEWQHVAAVANATTDAMRLYVNGKLVAEKALSAKTVNRAVATVTRGYALQRWVNACGGRGNSPIKFNGSIFTVDVLAPINRHGPFDADYRAWGGCYWWQNTRLPYWTMAAAGDFDLMPSMFNMYLDALPLRKHATKKYFGHDGAHFPETMYFWGTYNNDNYGRNRKGRQDGITENQYIRREWQGGIELVAMMLDYHAYTQDAKFLHDKLLPFAKEILTFNAQHYQRDANGKLNIYPAQALETWWDCTNPAPEVAGLHAVIPKLIALTNNAEHKAAWQKLFTELPPVPVKGNAGNRFLTPAARYANLRNGEMPELYPVFPYGLYGVGKPDLDVALGAWKRKRGAPIGGWSQTPIFAARLGLATTAQQLVTRNFSSVARGFTFPAMWGPNYDWVPDQDHGGVSMIGLQNMLLQHDGDEIRLLPAWPASWNADFKLHAPKNTIIRGAVINGKLIIHEVTPKSREKDLRIRQGDSFAPIGSQ